MIDNESKKSKRKDKFKGLVVVGSLTGALVGSVAYNHYTHTLKYYKKQLIKAGAYITDETEYGTIGKEDESSTFSLIDIGSAKDKVDINLEILKDTKIPTGIIVSPKSEKLSELYKEADYAMDIVASYDVEYPIFLNIDSLFETYINNTDDINIMVNEYVKKLQVNNCYVTVIGHKNYMDMLSNEKRKVDEAMGEVDVTYSIGLIVDRKFENVNEEMYDVIVGPEYVCARTNFKTIIKSNYNKESLYVDPYQYIVEAGDNLTMISDNAGLSVDTIKGYNNISDTIYPGQSITIPNKFLPPYYRGIDVSLNQGKIDWSNISSNIDFALIRAGYTSNSTELDSPCVIDSYFHYNLSECNKNNIPVGIYYTSKNYDKFRMEEEANALLRQLIDYKVDLPIYINIPIDSQLQNEETRRNIIECVDYFCTIINDNGYTPGIYAHENLVPFIPELKEKYTIWSYGGLNYNNRQRYNDMNFDYKVNEDVPIFQPTISGIPEDIGVEGTFWIGYDYADRDTLNAWLKDSDAKVKRFRNR